MKRDNDGDEWLTPGELAQEVKVPLKTIYRWNSTGEGPTPVPFGKHVRYSRASVARWYATKQEAVRPGKAS